MSPEPTVHDPEPLGGLLPAKTSSHGRLPPTGSEDDGEAVDRPGRVVRLAFMTRSLLEQLERLELDEAARHRLATVFNETVDALRELLSDELQEEVERLSLRLPDDPSTAELRVAHAQLVGWLDGLFHGIKTTLIAHELATQEELSRAFQRGQEAGRTEHRTAGHYL